MPSQQTVTHKEKILQKAAQRAADVASAAQTPAADNEEMQFLRSLQCVFPVEMRKELSSLTCWRDLSEHLCFNDLRSLAEKYIVGGAAVGDHTSSDLLNRLGRQSFAAAPEEEQGGCSRLSIFKGVTQRTAKDYARRLASLLTFCFVILGDQDLRDACGLRVAGTTLDAIKSFEEGFESDKEDVNHLVQFLISISGHQYGVAENYNADLLCSFAIGLMYDAPTGKFSSKEDASKTLSAIKYSLRMAVLYKLKGQENHDLSLVERFQYKQNGAKLAFKQLTILHAGVNSIPRKLRPAAMVMDKNCERVSYNGIPCSFDLLNDVLHSTVEEALLQIKDLLMGFTPPDIDTSEIEGSAGDSAVPFVPGFAFGQNPESEFGDLSLFNHVVGHAKWKKHFYGIRRQNPNKKKSRAFLKQCKKYERTILPLVHLLAGCGPRASDYGKLTFMNGDVESEARTVSIYDEDYIHCAMVNNKLTQLRGKNEGFSVFLPRKLADELFISYWKYVRPFALMLKLGTSGDHSCDRWRRSCFVQASDHKCVRSAICDAFGGVVKLLWDLG